MLVSAAFDADPAIGTLTRALAAIDVAALLLRGGGLDDVAFGEAIAPLVAEAQGRGIAVLLEDRPDLLAAGAADGLHVTLHATASPLKDLRRRFGEDVILGAGCGNSRHLAMSAGEEGADYIGFGGLDEGAPADPEIVAWWEAVMTPPQVAFGARTLDEARELAAAGPDFLALGPALWRVAEDPSAALRGLLAALADGA
jgi:thiamine-phosphate pyrophosphorylase